VTLSKAKKVKDFFFDQRICKECDTVPEMKRIRIRKIFFYTNAFI